MATLTVLHAGLAVGTPLLQYGGLAGVDEIGPVPKLVAIGVLLTLAAVVLACFGWLAYRATVERDRLEAAQEDAPDPTEL